MLRKINWIAWVVLVILWNYGFPQATPIEDVLVAVFLSVVYNYSVVTIKILEKVIQEVNLNDNEGALIMGIHYDYKSTRGDKARKKRLREKHVLSKKSKKI